MIEGSPTDPNAGFLRGGQQDVLQAAIDSGAITFVRRGILRRPVRDAVQHLQPDGPDGERGDPERHDMPIGRLRRLFEARGGVMPEGDNQCYGLPIPVFVPVLIAVVMAVVARKTLLGRHIFATGGNPDTAQLSSIGTRFPTVRGLAILGIFYPLSGGGAA